MPSRRCSSRNARRFVSVTAGPVKYPRRIVATANYLHECSVSRDTEMQGCEYRDWLRMRRKVPLKISFKV